MVLYGNRPETVLRSSPSANARRINHVLMGTWLREREREGDWIRVETRNAGRGGWVHEDDVRDTPTLKMFFVDVGQGDGCIIESPQGIVLVDGGPNSNYYRFMLHRYRPLFADGPVRIRAMIVSHPDLDHYQGFTSVLRDPNFEVDTIFHNGIARYYASDDRPFDLGTLRVRTIDGEQKLTLTSSFSTLHQARRILENNDDVQTRFRQFWQAALDAEAEGRLASARRLTHRDDSVPGFSGNPTEGLRIQVLGPVVTRDGGRIEYVGFPDPHDGRNGSPSSSHTRNGHSIILKLLFGRHSILLGGDLNIPAEQHLMAKYGNQDPSIFQVDVAKACHHGSSDFDIDFLRLVSPQVNVFSSGDNKSFDHPTADAVGAAARHSRGDRPLFFSTELGRAVSSSRVHYGLVNLRSNGEDLVMAQMKEQRRGADIWDSFTVPNEGKFPEWS